MENLEYYIRRLIIVFPLPYIHSVMKPNPKIEERRVQCLRNQPLRGGNLLYITKMKNSRMIQMKKPPFYI